MTKVYVLEFITGLERALNIYVNEESENVFEVKGAYATKELARTQAEKYYNEDYLGSTAEKFAEHDVDFDEAENVLYKVTETELVTA